MESVYSEIIRETIISDVADFVDIIDETIVDTRFLYYFLLSVLYWNDSYCFSPAAVLAWVRSNFLFVNSHEKWYLKEQSDGLHHSFNNILIIFGLWYADKILPIKKILI